jgi:hypothetical protein
MVSSKCIGSFYVQMKLRQSGKQGSKRKQLQHLSHSHSLEKWPPSAFPNSSWPSPCAPWKGRKQKHLRSWHKSTIVYHHFKKAEMSWNVNHLCHLCRCFSLHFKRRHWVTVRLASAEWTHRTWQKAWLPGSWIFLRHLKPCYLWTKSK